jgi:hypothetical protein
MTQRPPLTFYRASAPFKRGQTVVYTDGTLLQVTGCSRPLGCEWTVHVVYSRTGHEFDLPARAFKSLRDALRERIIDGGLAAPRTAFTPPTQPAGDAA